MLLSDIVQVLQLSIGPVIVISGAGLLLLSMTNRYGRVVDRIRICADSYRKSSPNEQVRFKTQLEFLMHRARLLRASVALVSISILLAALLVIAIFLIGLFKLEAASLVVALFVSCMISLIAGIVVFLIDINVSLAAVKVETRADLND